MLKRTLLALGVLVAAIAGANADPLDDAVSAYLRGDYKTTLALLFPLAEAGNAAAQTDIGNMYVNGEGVPEDINEGAKWYLRAAAQGDAQAQNVLGVMYYTGQGVTQDYVQSYLWFERAAAQGEEGGADGRDQAAAQLTPDQMAEAERLAQEWRPQPEQ